MAARVEMIRMGDRFTLASLLSAVAGEDMLAVVVVEVLVLVEVLLRHSWFHWYDVFGVNLEYGQRLHCVDTGLCVL